MIEHGVSGLLVGEKDPAALAGAMEEILLDPEKGSQFGAHDKALTTERYAVNVTTSQLKELLCRP